MRCRAEQVVRVEVLLDGAERLVQLGPELPGDPLAAAQAVAVLAAVGALVLAHQHARPRRRSRASWRAPSRRMSRIGRTCSVPTDACAYQVPRVPWRANTSVSASVYSARCSQRHRAVFDEADRLAVALQAHHDVQAGLAHLPQRLLRRLVDHLDHAAGQAQVAHQLDQRAQRGAAARCGRRR